LKTPEDAFTHPSLFRQMTARFKKLSIRVRIFVYLLLFVAVLLGLLWLFQIVLLDDFYRMLKTATLKRSAETIALNIDNPELQTLVERISQENDVSILILDEDLVKTQTADVNAGSIIHGMSKMDWKKFWEKAQASNNAWLELFDLRAFRNVVYDARRFVGRVPPPDNGRLESMLYVRLAARQDGKTAGIFLNALITPIGATVETLRSQMFIITVCLLMLSLLLSFIMSRRITRPIIDTNEAAKALSHGKFEPPHLKSVYREIGELNETLLNAAKDLRKVDQLQKELIANISHDLRTPLTMIGGYAEVMRDIPGENTPENMQVIIDETRRLSTLVNAVMDYSRLQSGGQELSLNVYDLTESVREVLKRYCKLTEQDGYEIVFEANENVTVLADDTKIMQVVYNLINNAIMYTGGDKKVLVRQTVENEKVTISVIDTGSGIPPEEIPEIWNRYYRAKSHRRAAIGTGLGLSIVKSILDMHNLPYGVESTLGLGSRFWFSVPVRKEAIPPV
jgi:signal transduction histidine kinase